MKAYVVIYEWTGVNYSACAPDLPGCVATAKSIGEAEDLMKTGIALYIEELKEEGLPVPEPTTKAWTVEVAA